MLELREAPMRILFLIVRQFRILSEVKELTAKGNSSFEIAKLVQLLWKSIWQFLRKLEIVLPEDPAIPLLGIYPKDVPPSHKDTLTHKDHKSQHHCKPQENFYLSNTAAKQKKNGFDEGFKSILFP